MLLESLQPADMEKQPVATVLKAQFCRKTADLATLPCDIAYHDSFMYTDVM